MIIFGYLVCYCFWFFYSKMLPLSYKKLTLNYAQKIILLVLVTFTLFAIFGTPGYINYGAESRLIALFSIYIIPIVIAACWPVRKWIRDSVQEKMY